MPLAMNSLSDLKNVYNFGHSKLSFHLATKLFLTTIGQYSAAAAAVTGHLSLPQDMTSATNCSGPRQANSLYEILNAVICPEQTVAKKGNRPVQTVDLRQEMASK